MVFFDTQGQVTLKWSDTARTLIHTRFDSWLPASLKLKSEGAMGHDNYTEKIFIAQGRITQQ